MTWYASNPPVNFSRSEANTFRSKVNARVTPGLVERVQVTHASIGVLYLFLPSHERAYSLFVFSLPLPCFALFPLYFTSQPLIVHPRSVSTLIPWSIGQFQGHRSLVKVSTRNLPDATPDLIYPQVCMTAAGELLLRVYSIDSSHT